MRICVYGGASTVIGEKYITATEDLGRKIAQRGHGMVFGAGANGLMGAVARGVNENGGEIIGVVPTFFNVDGALFDKCTQLIRTETMRERKQIMEDNADAFIMTPGGIGTFEEFFEILTLKQLGRHTKPIAIFSIDGYYDGIAEMMETAIRENFIREEIKNLYKVFEDINQMLDYLETCDRTEYSILDLKDIK
ncbi:MAG: TIGR00730 family Rossman fold protein [Eubacteriales bacterium]|nr:TIGR00730 family Rossman fold protein [Eubacteriales bacterium]